MSKDGGTILMRPEDSSQHIKLQMKSVNMHMAQIEKTPLLKKSAGENLSGF